MGKISLILFIILLHSCSKEDMVPYDLEGNWVVVSFEDYETSGSVTKTEENTWSDYNNGDITVYFSVSDGKISGKKVTNTFSGDFTTAPGNQLAIKNIFGTEVNEPEWGRMFHSIIYAESYEVKGRRLIIYYNNKLKGIVLERPEN